MQREPGITPDDNYESKMGPGMFALSRGKDKQKMSSILTVRFYYIIVLLCLPIAYIIYGEFSLWFGGLLLCLPLFIRFRRRNKE